MDTKTDMRVDPVDGSPISLRKVGEVIGDKRLVVLTNGSGIGIVNDDPYLVDISIQEREIQADYFFGLNVPFPEYLRKYLTYMYEDDSDVDIESLYKYGGTNGEFRHIVAIIQMVMYAMKTASRERKSVRMYIEEPETRLHPKRQRRIIPMLEMLRVDFGSDEPKPEE